MSIDPVEFSVSSPGMFGRYTYTLNDPVNNIDPDGRNCKGTRIGSDSGSICGGGGGFNSSSSGGEPSSSKPGPRQNQSGPSGGGGSLSEDDEFYYYYPLPAHVSGLTQTEFNNLDPMEFNSHRGVLAGMFLMEERIGETMTEILNNEIRGHPYQNFRDNFTQAQLPRGGWTYRSFKVGIENTRRSADNSPVRIVQGTNEFGRTQYYLTVTHYQQFVVISPNWTVK